MGSKRVWDTVFGDIWLAGLCCCLVISCSQTEDGLSPLEPPPPASLVDLFGDVLHRADGSEVGFETLEGKAIVGIFFAAGWCSACGGFTPLLVTAYEEIEQAGKSFEVVFVSLDDSADDMFAYMNERGMPWLALPFRGVKAEALGVRYNVSVIPTLVVIDDEGNTITMNGRIDVVEKGALAYDDWLAR